MTAIDTYQVNYRAGMKLGIKRSAESSTEGIAIEEYGTTTFYTFIASSSSKRR